MKKQSELLDFGVVYQFGSDWVFEEEAMPSSDPLLSQRLSFYGFAEELLNFKHSQQSIRKKLTVFIEWLQLTDKKALPLDLRIMDTKTLSALLLKENPLLQRNLLSLCSIVYKLRITLKYNSGKKAVQELYGSKEGKVVFVMLKDNSLVIRQTKEKVTKAFCSPKQVKKDFLATRDSLNTSASDCKDEQKEKKTPPKKNKLRFKKPLKLNFEYKPAFSSFIPVAFRKKVYAEDKSYHVGVLKFFSKKNQYGFIMTQNEKDIFVHQDDLEKANVDIKTLNQLKRKFNMILKFRAIDYQGKNKVSRKAIDLCIVGYEPRI